MKPLYVALGTVGVGVAAAAAGGAFKSPMLAKVGAGIAAMGAGLTVLDFIQSRGEKPKEREQEAHKEVTKAATEHPPQPKPADHRQAGHVTQDELNEAVRRAVAEQHTELRETVAAEIRNAFNLPWASAWSQIRPDDDPMVRQFVAQGDTLEAARQKAAAIKQAQAQAAARKAEEEGLVPPPGSDPSDCRNAGELHPPPGSDPDEHRNAPPAEEAYEVIDHQHRNDVGHQAEHVEHHADEHHHQPEHYADAA